MLLLVYIYELYSIFFVFGDLVEDALFFEKAVMTSNIIFASKLYKVF